MTRELKIIFDFISNLSSHTSLSKESFCFQFYCRRRLLYSTILNYRHSLCALWIFISIFRLVVETFALNFVTLKLMIMSDDALCVCDSVIKCEYMFLCSLTKSKTIWWEKCVRKTTVKWNNGNFHLCNPPSFIPNTTLIWW